MSLEQMMAELRKDYVDSLPKKLVSITDHWTSGQIDELKNDFHKLKGTGKTYGLPEITDVGLIMEHLCKVRPDQLKVAMPLAQSALKSIYALRSQNKDVTLDTVTELRELKKFETP